MCNFHESVAVQAATDPITGRMHAGHKAVIRVALSRYWASRYVEGAENVDGYNFYPLATRVQQEAFAASGLNRPLSEISAMEQEHLSFLRERILELSRRMDLSENALRLPLKPAREAFMDLAIDQIYEGDPKGDFRVVRTVSRDDLVPLHHAVSALHADAKTSSVLEKLVQGRICTLYTEAPQKVYKPLVDAYEGLPESVKTASSNMAKYGGNILLGGFSGIVGHGVHYGSVLGAGVAAGSASSLNMALSGVFLLASYGGWRELFGGKYRAVKENVSAFAIQGALTLAVAVGAQQFLEHDHMKSEKARWYESLTPEMREAFLSDANRTYASLPSNLRERLDDAAQDEGLPPAVFLLICSGGDPVSRDINTYLSETKTMTYPVFVSGP